MPITYIATKINLGEFRMGCVAYGLHIKTTLGEFKALEAQLVLVEGDPNQSIEFSKCNRYLIVSGLFAVYVLDLEETAISLIKGTIRERIADANEDFTVWSEETPIYGRDNFHLDGASGKHYFLQFPFVPDYKFTEVFKGFHELRVKQILQARTAI